MLDGKREPVGRPTVESGEGAPKGAPGHEPPSAEQIEDWLATYLSKLLDIEEERVDTTISFSRYGLDSSASIVLLSDLSDWLGCEADPDLLYSHPTIATLAKRLGGSEEPR